MIHFRCGSCGESIKITDGHAGKRFKCPSCGKSGTVPQPDKPLAPLTCSGAIGLVIIILVFVPEEMFLSGAVSAIVAGLVAKMWKRRKKKVETK